jgi:SAM-dependent methyltransferase
VRNVSDWVETKYVMRDGRLRANRNTRWVGVGSRHISDLIASHYEVALPRFARGALLDLGCGTVPLFKSYSPHVSSVTCVDWPQSPHAISHIDISHNLADPLPFDSGSFDTVILSDVLEHIAQPGALLREIARVLRPDGVLLLNTPFMYWIHEAPFDYFRYTAFGLRHLAESSGLSVHTLVPIGGLADVLTDILAKLCATVPVLGSPMSRALQMLSRLSLRPSARYGSARNPETRFPLGYFMVCGRVPSSADSARGARE